MEVVLSLYLMLLHKALCQLCVMIWLWDDAYVAIILLLIEESAAVYELVWKYETLIILTGPFPVNMSTL